MAKPWFWLGLAAIFALERWRPAIPGARIVGPALGYDFIWFVAEVLTNSGLLLAYGHFVYTLYDSHLAFLRVSAVAELPALRASYWSHCSRASRLVSSLGATQGPLALVLSRDS